jgi:hypothetical protein
MEQVYVKYGGKREYVAVADEVARGMTAAHREILA